MASDVELTFLGAAGTVTGSMTLVQWSGGSLLVDCGLFQGFKAHRRLNWKPLPVDPASLDAVLLTHAHIDHAGRVPLLVKQGYEGPVYGTPGTTSLCEILLPDSGHLQEEAAERANRRGYSKHHPAKPLYTAEEAVAALASLRKVPFGERLELPGGAVATFFRAGHILGASGILLEVAGKRLWFSGDVGRPRDPMLHPPVPVPAVDALVVESTYGERRHVATDPEEDLAVVVRRTLKRGGHVIVPAFAVGRTQRILYHLWRLMEEGRIPRVPVFLNSPLATKATDAFKAHPEELLLDRKTCAAACGLPTIVATREESIALNRRTEPCIMIAGSGMATGGRVVHHIRAFAPDPKHTLLFAGFQAGGTRGDRITRGESEVKIFGEWVPIRCEVAELHNLSAHADHVELLDWLKQTPQAPTTTFVNHGSPEAADAMRIHIQETLGWDVEVPLLGESFTV